MGASPDPTPPEVMRAFIEYLKRQNGHSFPSGVLEDGVWIPDKHEYLSCCLGLHISKLYEHSKGVQHCALYFGADPKATQALVDLYTGKEERDAQRQTKKSPVGLGSYKVRDGEIRRKIARLH